MLFMILIVVVPCVAAFRYDAIYGNESDNMPE